MNNLKIFFIFLLVLSFNVKSFAEELEKKDGVLSSDIVDLNPKHWAYKPTIKAIDKYKFISAFPDHTFRGDKNISREDFLMVILKLIRNYEQTKNISIKTDKIKLNESLLIKLKDSNYLENITEINTQYGFFITLPDEKEFITKLNVNNAYLAYILNQLISNIASNIKLSKTSDNTEKDGILKLNFDKKEDLQESLKNIFRAKILQEKDFKPNKKITRYELCASLIKTIEYLDMFEQF